MSNADNIRNTLIELSTFNEMSVIGRFHHEGITYNLQIYREEGTEGYPHFHLHVSSQSYETDICIRLDVPEYFEYGSHCGRFNSRGKKKLDNYLRTTDPVKNETVWERLVNDWNNTQKKKVIIVKQPNYRLLPDANDSNISRRIH